MINIEYTIVLDPSDKRARLLATTILYNVWEMRNYVWGAGTLAFLYREIWMTSRTEAKEIS